MALQTIILIIEWLRNIILIMALYFGVKTIKALLKTDSKNEIVGMKRIVFTLVVIGLFFLLIGLITEGSSWVMNKNFTLLGIMCFSLAYIFLLIAFAYFWHDSSRFHMLHLSEPVFFLGVAAGVMLWIYYLFRITMQANAFGLSLINKIVLLIHPLAVAMIFLLTLIIHPAHKAKVIRTPLWYISSGVFLYFIGYNIIAYSFIKPVAKLIPLVYTIFLFLSAAYFNLGLFAASRKFGKGKLIEKQEEKIESAEPDKK